MDINTIWDAIAPYVTGTGIGGIIGLIFGAYFKSIVEKTFSKNNIKRISQETVNESVGQIKKVSFSQNIQPLVEDQMKKVLKVMNGHIDETLKTTKDNYKALLEVIIALSDYFNNSYGVPEDVKAKLKTAIENAKELGKEDSEINYSVTINEENVVVETIEEVIKDEDVVR